jgi:hypothetical protein
VKPELEDTERRVVLDLAVRNRPPALVVANSARPDYELSDSPAGLVSARVLAREALVVVHVPVQNDIGPRSVESAP